MLGAGGFLWHCVRGRPTRKVAGTFPPFPRKFHVEVDRDACCLHEPVPILLSMVTPNEPRTLATRHRSTLSSSFRAMAVVLCALSLSACCRACTPNRSSGTRFHASAGKCSLSVSIKGPTGILYEQMVSQNWTSQEYQFKSGDRVSFSVFAVSCTREPTCKLTKDGKEFGIMDQGKTGNIICSGIVP